MKHILAYRARLDADAETSRPKETRTHAQLDAMAKKDATRRQVAIKRLRQQGLSLHEATEQATDRLWRRV